MLFDFQLLRYNYLQCKPKSSNSVFIFSSLSQISITHTPVYQCLTSSKMIVRNQKA